jgi:dienelactone hydrolase
MTETHIRYAAANKNYVGALIPADSAAPRAAVVLLPDWRGQSALALAHARYLSRLGCIVAIADLYGDGFNPTSPDQVGPMVQHLIAHREEGIEALSACVTALRARAPTAVPIFCLGFSAGGMIALDFARSGAEIAGVMVCSALLKTAPPGIQPRLRAPVLVLQGTQDQVSPMPVIDALIAEFDAVGADVRFELFTQTHHAFDNPEAGSNPAARLVYSPRAAARARASIARFIDEVLAASAG